MSSTPPVRIVAIVGGSGAGKTWLASRLCRLLSDKACHLHLDDFYRDRSHLSPARRARVNYDIPAAIDWAAAERALRTCRAGQPAPIPRYDFATHCRVGERTWQPRPVVFADGLWLLRSPAIRALVDLGIFLDTPAKLRCSRRMTRDVVERGYFPEAIAHQLRTAVLPMHERHVEPQKKWADLVLQEPLDEAGLVALADGLWHLLTESALLPPWMHETFRAELIERLLPGGTGGSPVITESGPESRAARFLTAV